MFKVNERFSKKNYYLSLLPKYRTTPVFIFENKSANIQMPKINSTTDLKIQNCEKIIHEQLDTFLNAVAHSISSRLREMSIFLLLPNF